MPLKRSSSLAALAILGSVTAPVALPAAPPRLADCDSAAPWQVLRAGTAAGTVPEARAVWLDAQVVRWPGVEPTGRFRLYHSADARVAAASGARVLGADGALDLAITDAPLPNSLQQRFRYLDGGVTLRTDATADVLRDLHRGQLVLVQEDDAGRVLRSTRLQSATALDDLFAAARDSTLGATVAGGRTTFALWAPTAENVAVCLHRDGAGPAASLVGLKRDPASGIWSATAEADLSGRYYTYLVDLYVPGTGVVRNRVTDPYAVSLTTDSQRAYIADLDAPQLAPPGWSRALSPDRVRTATDAQIYELHVRDFSIGDASVRPVFRG